MTVGLHRTVSLLLGASRRVVLGAQSVAQSPAALADDLVTARARAADAPAYDRALSSHAGLGPEERVPVALEQLARVDQACLR